MDSIRTWAEGGCPSGTCGIPHPGGLISNLSYRWGDWEGRQRDWALSLFIWLLLHCSKGKAQPADFPPPELWTWRRLASKKGIAGAPLYMLTRQVPPHKLNQGARSGPHQLLWVPGSPPYLSAYMPFLLSPLPSPPSGSLISLPLPATPSPVYTHPSLRK